MGPKKSGEYSYVCFHVEALYFKFLAIFDIFPYFVKLSMKNIFLDYKQLHKGRI